MAVMYCTAYTAPHPLGLHPLGSVLCISQTALTAMLYHGTKLMTKKLVAVSFI